MKLYTYIVYNHSILQCVVVCVYIYVCVFYVYIIIYVCVIVYYVFF